MVALDRARAVTAAGRLLERALELEFDARHFRIDWADITCEERDAIKILETERGRWDRESAKRVEQERELEKLRNRQR